MAVVKTIGVGGGFSSTPSYTSLVDWEAYLNTSPFLDDEVGRVLWTSSVNELSATDVTFDGSVPLLFNIYLEAGDASGSALGSFRNHPNKATNPLRYNPANGAAVIESSGVAGITVSDPNVIIRYLQFNRRVGYGLVIDYGSGGDSGKVIDSCILAVTVTAGNSYIMRTVNDTKVLNCLMYHSGLFSPSGNQLFVYGGGTRLTSLHNTLAMTGSAGSALIACGASFSSGEVRDSIFYGTPRDMEVSAGANTQTTNATWLSTASSSMQPANTIFNIVASDFVSVTRGSEDFRISSAGSALAGVGSTATSTITVDIIGQTRS